MSRKILKFKAMRGPLRGHLFVIKSDGVFSIGRAKNMSLSLFNDPCVSRSHAKITIEGDVVLVMDNQSTNGTYLNKRKLTKPHRLILGDCLILGNSLLRYDGILYQNQKNNQ